MIKPNWLVADQFTHIWRFQIDAVSNNAVSNANGYCLNYNSWVVHDYEARGHHHVACGVVFMRQGDARWGSRCPGPCPEHDQGTTAPSACAVLLLGFGTMAARQRGHAARARRAGTLRGHAARARRAGTTCWTTGSTACSTAGWTTGSRTGLTAGLMAALAAVNSAEVDLMTDVIMTDAMVETMVDLAMT